MLLRSDTEIENLASQECEHGRFVVSSSLSVKRNTGSLHLGCRILFSLHEKKFPLNILQRFAES